MALKNLRQVSSSADLSVCTTHENVKAVANSRKYALRGQLKGRIFSSLALILNVYSNDNYLRSGDKFSTSNSINLVYDYFKNIFDQNKNTSFPVHNSTVETHQSPSYFSHDLKLWYVKFISKNLHNPQRPNVGSLCINLTRLAMCAPNVSTRDYSLNEESEDESLVNVAHLLVKLSKLMRRASRSREHTLAAETDAPLKTQNTSTSTSIETSDKSIQCSKSTEFLKVSSDTKFFSRSSIVINVDPSKTNLAAKLDRRQQQQQQQRQYRNSSTLPSPSLEYIANYRPEYSDGLSNLRSFSSSAIFTRKSDEKASHSADRGVDALSSKYNLPSKSQKLRSHRRVHANTERLKETIRRTEDEILRYSNFITEDLASFRNQNDKDQAIELDENDVASVKQILLDDYITEVKQIIRAESCKPDDDDDDDDDDGDDCKILENVKQRMDEDVVEGSIVSAAESWHSTASPCKSAYATARESLKSRNADEEVEEDCEATFGSRCYCYCCCCCCRCRHDKSLRFRRYLHARKLQGDGYCCDATKLAEMYEDSDASSRDRLKHELKCRDEVCSNDRVAKAENASKSSQSVDSGVAIDYPRNSSCYWQSSSSSSSTSSTTSSFTERSCNDEILCQRVENAVKKFTDELIKCERRAKNRVTGEQTDACRQTLRAPVTPTDQSEDGINSFNYPTNSRRRYSVNRCDEEQEEEEEDEDDYDARISTPPSLVSMSD